MTLIERVKEAVRLADVLDAFGIQLRRGTFRCPLHDDQHPSAHAYGERWWCFTCNLGGDCIDLTATCLNVDVSEALRFRFGIATDYTRPHRATPMRNDSEANQIRRALIEARHAADRFPRYRPNDHGLNARLDLI